MSGPYLVLLCCTLGSTRVMYLDGASFPPPKNKLYPRKKCHQEVVLKTLCESSGIVMSSSARTFRVIAVIREICWLLGGNTTLMFTAIEHDKNSLILRRHPPKQMHACYPWHSKRRTLSLHVHLQLVF